MGNIAIGYGQSSHVQSDIGVHVGNDALVCFWLRLSEDIWQEDSVDAAKTMDVVCRGIIIRWICHFKKCISLPSGVRLSWRFDIKRQRSCLATVWQIEYNCMDVKKLTKIMEE